MTQRFLVHKYHHGDGERAVGLEMAQIRSLRLAGELSGSDLVRPQDESLWASAAAWQALDIPAGPPARHQPHWPRLPEPLLSAGPACWQQLRWWLLADGAVRGPLDYADLCQQVQGAQAPGCMVSLSGSGGWFPAKELVVDRASARSMVPVVRCAVCLELSHMHGGECGECGEPAVEAVEAAEGSVTPMGPHALPGATWLRRHWRPALTMALVFSVVAFGIALRHLAPARYEPAQRMAAHSTMTQCADVCWHGEACQLGRCVWQPPNDVAHLAENITISGPFELPRTFSDALPLDSERFAVAHLHGVLINNARTGGALSLVSDAPQIQGLHRVGDVIYAAAPRRIFVLDAATTQVLKTIELQTRLGGLTVGANGRRVLASLPGAHAVAMIATDYHAEVSRFYFGDDRVRSVAIDDTGSRGLTTNGQVPLAGLRAPRNAVKHGAVYAFDPGKLPSKQDQVRTALVGNPVDVAMAPDSKSSFVVLREKDLVVRLERLGSGAVRQVARLHTCRQPEEIVLLHRRRRAIVRCNAGQAVEVFDLKTLELLRRVPVGARVADVVVTPDGRQALLALPRHGAGALGVLDLDSYELRLHELSAEPHRLRLAPDGRTALVISDRTKVAWVVR